MRPELSIVLPVRNLDSDVSLRIERLLDYTGDLTPNFEIVVIDDFSTDETAEIVAEMSRSFPQIVLKQNYCEKGFLKSIEKGCKFARANRIFIVEMGTDITPKAMQQFWQSHAPNNLFQFTTIKRIKPLSNNLLNRLDAWCVQLQREQTKGPEIALPENSRIDQPQEKPVSKRAPLRIPVVKSKKRSV